MKEDTYFAPPERSSILDINLDNKFLNDDAAILGLLGAVSGITAILDGKRQIVYANDELLGLLGIDSIEPVLGKRPGEAVSCVHSGETEYGCGTSEACSVCGAVGAIIESQLSGQKTVRETRITSEIDGKMISWDLKVTSSPLKIRERQYYIFTLQDISGEKRRENLEKIFFHDLLNSAGNLNGLLTILKEGTDPKETREIIEMSEEVSRDLLEEISLHRQLRAAEKGDLVVDLRIINTMELLLSVIGKMEGHEVAHEKRIAVEDHSSGIDLKTDRILLQRVLMNMLKNALEATEKGGIVFAGVQTFEDKVRFHVKNDKVMPADNRLQVFQRSFTTKGIGRGVGTYSIKLLTENYLRGKAGFTSSESEGTVFFVDLFRNES
jgi:signal transduction histidine kinase